MATEPGESSVVDLNARFTSAPSGTARSRKRLRAFLWIGFALTAAGLVLDFVYFPPQSASRSDEVTALISGGEVPVSIGNIEIRATNALFWNNTDLATAIQQCGTDNQKYVPHANNKLTRNILVLQVTRYGPACVPEDQVRRFGSVNIEARDLSPKAIDGAGKPLQHSDGKDVYFKEIGLWVEPSTSEKVESVIPNALLGLGVGILVTCLFEWRQRGARRVTQASPNAHGAGDESGRKP